MRERVRRAGGEEKERAGERARGEGVSEAEERCVERLGRRGGWWRWRGRVR